jgi:1-acyl-sn-glycerol-3-phosphate acyltransferase
MDWLLFHICISAFILLILPYTFYSSLYLFFSSFATAAELVYHLAIMVHGIGIILYLQWVPRESEYFRSHWCWEWFRKSYFSFQLHDPHGVFADKTTQYIVAIHPHGVYPAALDVLFAVNPEMMRFKAVATSILFKIPLLKEFAGLAGAIPANRSDILTALSCKDSIVLAPGGIRETFCTGNEVVKRQGFLKIAHFTKVPVVPIWSPQEEQLYSVYFPWPWAQKKLLSAFYYPFFILSWGNPWVPFFWKRPSKPMDVYVGKVLHPEHYSTAQDLQDAFYREIETLQRNVVVKK